MKNSDCPFCEDTDHRFEFATNQYNLVQCGTCELVYKSESSEASELAINQELYTDDFVERRQWGKKRLFNVAKRRLEALKSQIPDGGRILEIGCGTGEFLQLARTEGYKVEAVDMSKSVCHYVENRLGIPCFNGTLQEFHPDHKDYDAIVAFDIIEHLVEPNVFLKQLLNRLGPSGVLFLEMPNWQCLEQSVFGHLWNMINIRDHVSFFSKKSWETVANRMKLKINFIQSHEAYWEAPFATIFALLNLRRIKKYNQLQSINPVPAQSEVSHESGANGNNLKTFISQELPALIAKLLSPLTFPFRWLVNRAGWGTELSVMLHT